MAFKVHGATGTFASRIEGHSQIQDDLELDDIHTSRTPAGSVSQYHDEVIRDRGLSRTPSPTPSEAEEVDQLGTIDWRKYCNWRFWLRREWLPQYIFILVLISIVSMISVYSRPIAHWLEPTARRVRSLPFGWLIPIIILIILSFPPLIGFEVVCMLCGLVWGLYAGFAIVSVAVCFGELANYFTFKYLCLSRSDKLKKSNLLYACMAKIVQDSGLTISVLGRYMILPSPVVITIFATCDMSIISFIVGSILSLPQYVFLVYIGSSLEQAEGGVTTSADNEIFEDVMLALSFLLTAFAMWYLYRKLNEVKPSVIYARRKARQARLEMQSRSHATEFTPARGVSPQFEESEPDAIPLLGADDLT